MHYSDPNIWNVVSSNRCLGGLSKTACDFTVSKFKIPSWYFAIFVTQIWISKMNCISNVLIWILDIQSHAVTLYSKCLLNIGKMEASYKVMCVRNSTGLTINQMSFRVTQKYIGILIKNISICKSDKLVSRNTCDYQKMKKYIWILQYSKSIFNIKTNFPTSKIVPTVQFYNLVSRNLSMIIVWKLLFDIGKSE